MRIRHIAIFLSAAVLAGPCRKPGRTTPRGSAWPRSSSSSARLTILLQGQKYLSTQVTQDHTIIKRSSSNPPTTLASSAPP